MALRTFGALRKREIANIAERAARFICEQPVHGEMYSVCVDDDRQVSVLLTDDANPDFLLGSYRPPLSWIDLTNEIAIELEDHYDKWIATPVGHSRKAA